MIIDFSVETVLILPDEPELLLVYGADRADQEGLLNAEHLHEASGHLRSLPPTSQKNGRGVCHLEWNHAFFLDTFGEETTYAPTTFTIWSAYIRTVDGSPHWDRASHEVSVALLPKVPDTLSGWVVSVTELDEDRISWRPILLPHRTFNPRSKARTPFQRFHYPDVDPERPTSWEHLTRET